MIRFVFAFCFVYLHFIHSAVRNNLNARSMLFASIIPIAIGVYPIIWQPHPTINIDLMNYDIGPSEGSPCIIDVNTKNKLNIQHCHIIVFSLYNPSQLTITKNDFLYPISIFFEENQSDMKIINTSIEQYQHPDAELKIKDSHIELSFSQLKPKESIEFSVSIYSQAIKITAKSNIIGVDKINTCSGISKYYDGCQEIDSNFYERYSPLFRVFTSQLSFLLFNTGMLMFAFKIFKKILLSFVLLNTKSSALVLINNYFLFIRKTKNLDLYQEFNFKISVSAIMVISSILLTKLQFHFLM